MTEIKTPYLQKIVRQPICCFTNDMLPVYFYILRSSAYEWFYNDQYKYNWVYEICYINKYGSIQHYISSTEYGVVPVCKI